jgi:lysophospholipase L1-like esterase
MSPMQPTIELKPDSTIVLIGDSITDADHNLHAYQPFGNGYVNFVANYLLAKYPQMNLRIINTGIGGDTIHSLQGRWQEDCLKHDPDVLSMLIGINDVWWQYAESEGFAKGAHATRYELTYRRLLSQAKQKCNCQFVLAEPFMFCSDRENQMLEGLRTYIAAVHKLAAEFDAVLVPLQSRLDAQLEHVPPQKWSADSVHPYVWAHAWIAQRWIEATSL